MIQKRYYSLRELYRKYSIYLKNKFSAYNLSEYSRSLLALREFFSWIKEKSLTIYTIGEVELKEFLLYLCSPQYPKRYPRPALQRRKKSIQHFYEWLFSEKLIEVNPFTQSLFFEITALIRNRGAPTPSPPQKSIPLAFKEIYELAQKTEAVRGYHPKTVYMHNRCWRAFFEWLEQEGICQIEQVQEKELIRYQNYLISCGLSANKRLRHLTALKAFYTYLRLTMRISYDPSHVIELPRCTGGLPYVLMSRYDVEKMISLPDVTTPMGVRDRAIMEVFYSTGMRLNELCHLKEEDVLFQEGMIRVMVPKGGVSRQRVVSIGRVALEWVRKYLDGSRPFLLRRNRETQKPEYLFLNAEGGALRKFNLMTVMRNYRLKGGFKKLITSHSFRVTCATEMLRNRADIRYVQAQLGHELLTSTQIYARVLPTDLKKVHQRTHPRERNRALEENLFSKNQ